ncbi:MAG: hypothetical protein IPO78_17995 [Saprospiraceae bacterium]|nr:hypothetical protein [Saprospiraceae bacterium]
MDFIHSFLLKTDPHLLAFYQIQGYDLIPGTQARSGKYSKEASTTIYGAQSMAGAINGKLKKTRSGCSSICKCI